MLVAHVGRMPAVIRLHGVHHADRAVGGEAHPHLHVAGVRVFRTVPAQALLQPGADDGARSRNGIGLFEAMLEKLRAGEDSLLAREPAGGFAPGIPIDDDQRQAIGHSNLWVLIHHPGCAPEGSGCQHVVRREQERVVSLAPFEEPLVVGRDMPLVLLVPPELHPLVALGQAGAHRRRIVGGAVVDDEDPHLDAVLVERAADALLEKAAVVVAGDHHVDRAHRSSFIIDGPLPRAAPAR